ncbi:DNA glycosylase AlkZ-like family protein [Streptomyces endophytica]|uniref:Winged helix DNA-binding domain-containing protein n=1 Tax=Streptomyces endophytica TaxID=2991496 RepID=A0ABY6P8U5_9ACTN|nr:crosslink repair DNA glycosylase YcaQ family protein [Streptomyces endophytica]UZJ30240.1 winged helix DNA-binding domain-containing protein [Streptomyces endophytica]
MGKPSWQRAFGVDPRQMAALGEAVDEILDGQVLTRQELIDAVLARPGLGGLGEQLASGWGTVLKPLAWTGRLIQGPPQGQNVTFTAPSSWVPGWGGVPDPDEAAPAVISAYLAAHGPATPATFDAWLLRGATRKAVLRGWFASLGDRLTPVEIEPRAAARTGAGVGVRRMCGVRTWRSWRVSSRRRRCGCWRVSISTSSGPGRAIRG